MKKALLLFSLIFVSLFASAQSYNPYVSQGIISPSPLLPAEFNGTGLVSFNIGNTGSNTLPLVENQEMTLVITLGKGVPDNVDPLAAMGGTWLHYFDWSYNAGITTYFGTQNQEIPGNYAQGDITITYKVTINSPIGNASNGFNVNIQPPPYANGSNTTDDDAVSSYTYVKALDYGDAPLSYGEAFHEINVFKTAGNYTHYIYLGTSIDPEPSNQDSVDADGDDTNGIDDEDGVIMPSLVRGATVNIPVVVTSHNLSDFSTLNAWFDWNGDGDFGDSGEAIPLELVMGSGTFYIEVTVP
ncbi:MAG: GEVED domain-containing protein, partial [Bacteroidota bacterium]